MSAGKDIELLACPFCGDSEHGVMQMHSMDESPPRPWARVTCHTCGAMAPEPTWNRRSPTPPDGWVPWKPGDALPEYGEYLVTMQDTETHVDGRTYVSTWTAIWKPLMWVHSPERRVIAYWPVPLAPPYQPSGEER